jgi:hypothetical protein
VVVPSLARVMIFRRPGKSNLLFAPREVKDVGGWMNHGGDKLWFAPQSIWGWPPDSDLDQAPHSVELKRNRLVMTSPVSRKWGLQLQRELWVTGATLHSLNRVTNFSGKVMKVSAWQVTQIGQPRRVLLELGPSNQWYGYKTAAPLPGYDEVEGGVMSLTPHPTQFRKFGSRGYRAMAVTAAREAVALTNFLQRDGEYPDEGSAMQVFLGSKESGYIELEAAGPLRALKPGESAEFLSELTVIEGREETKSG